MAILAVIGAGCADLEALFGPSRPDPAAQMPALETSIFNLVQAERQKIDPKPRTLVLDAELTGVARRRSAEMARQNSFVDGRDPHVSATMLMQQDAKFQGLVGENVAALHFTPGSDIDVEAFARRFVDGWLASKPHLQNLSFADYDRTGVGAAVNGDTVYVTQLFTTDLGLGSNEATEPPSETIAPPARSDGTPPLRGAILPRTPSD